MASRLGLLRWSLLALLLVGQAAAAGELSCLVAAAREQVGVTLHYDGSYQRLDYPGGDVPIERGVCTDVLVRAWRRLGIDLQQRVHEDMRANFHAYPAFWGLRRPDPNIDHRRVPNLATYFTRKGNSLPIRVAVDDFQPGDLVTWMLPGGLPHIGIVSDRLSPEGRPLVIHNVGAGTREEDVLLSWTLTGRYRYAADACHEPSVVFRSWRPFQSPPIRARQGAVRRQEWGSWQERQRCRGRIEGLPAGGPAKGHPRCCAFSTGHHRSLRKRALRLALC